MIVKKCAIIEGRNVFLKFFFFLNFCENIFNCLKKILITCSMSDSNVLINYQILFNYMTK